MLNMEVLRQTDKEQMNTRLHTQGTEGAADYQYWREIIQGREREGLKCKEMHVNNKTGNRDDGSIS